VIGSPRLLGSIVDLAAWAAGRPIYCTGQFNLHPELIRCNLAWLRCQTPGAEFISARGLYADLDEWRERWPKERTLYGAAVVMTVGEDVPESEHPLTTRFGGRHEIGAAVMTEITGFVEMRRPVAWLAFIWPKTFWFSRFAVEGLEEGSAARMAGLFPAADGKTFVPTIWFPWFHVVSRDEP
jgi:hypothetical protein